MVGVSATPNFCSTELEILIAQFQEELIAGSLLLVYSSRQEPTTVTQFLLYIYFDNFS